MNDIAIIKDDGFSVAEKSSETLISGKMLKFNDGRYTVDKTELLPPNTVLAAVGSVTVWVHWVDGKPAEHRITQSGQQHPEREELPDLDESAWPPGLNDEPSDPWRDTRYLHLIDPQTGADYTFVTDSFGGRRAVHDLKSQIANVRFAHPNAVAIVQPASTTMKTHFGLKMRPAFKVVGWRGKQEKAPPQAIEPRKESINDDIPY